MSGSSKFHGEDGKVIQQEEDHSKEDYLAKQIIKEFGILLSARANDLPHRFEAPAIFGEFMRGLAEYTTADYYTQHTVGYGSVPLIVRYMIRARKNQLVIEFDDANGSRMFTLEIDYGAIPEKG